MYRKAFLTLCVTAGIIGAIAILGIIMTFDRMASKPEPVREAVVQYEQLPDYIRRVDDHERGVSCYYRNSGQFSCVPMRNQQ